MKKTITFIAVFLCGYLLLLQQNNWLSAQITNEKQPEQVGATLSGDVILKHIDENGKIIIDDTEELEAITKQEQAETERLSKIKGIGGAKNISYGVVNFKTKSSANYNTSYTDVATGQSGYTNGYYGADGAFLGYTNNGTKVKFMLSGVVGLVDADEVEVLDYEDESTVKSVNYYYCKNGNIYHYITLNVRQPYYSSVLMVGKQQSYMKSNTVYYSYDGHYFYTTYEKMINDYKADTRKNSINPSNPYYNYYQYVSTRTKTNFTADDFNGYVKSYLGSSYNASNTKMYEMGKYFIDYQNTYGAYALSTFGVAVNESYFGTSSIALSKNNLFGHNAVDSDPGLANGYSSPQNSIRDHAKYYVNLWYSTPKYSSYHGSYLGDKAGGMNVSYASDPYWGETAAHWMWQLDEYSKNSDANSKTLVVKDNSSVNIRKEATTSSSSLYTTSENIMSFILLDTVKGDAVSGNTTWYKVQLDTPLNSSRTGIDYSGNSYNFSKSYGYIHSSLLTKVNSGTDSSGGNSGGSSGGNTGSSAYKLGDVNDDGKISPADYVKVKNHIMGRAILKDNSLKAADVNKDGKISPADYVKIKNHIMGKDTIKE
ncbi:MAG: dockerin type I domain-containing protein [Clostridium sp.]